MLLNTNRDKEANFWFCYCSNKFRRRFNAELQVVTVQYVRHEQIPRGYVVLLSDVDSGIRSTRLIDYFRAKPSLTVVGSDRACGAWIQNFVQN